MMSNAQTFLLHTLFYFKAILHNLVDIPIVTRDWFVTHSWLVVIVSGEIAYYATSVALVGTIHTSSIVFSSANLTSFISYFLILLDSSFLGRSFINLS